MRSRFALLENAVLNWRQTNGSETLPGLRPPKKEGPPQKVTSKPLPPRLSLVTFRHLKRAHLALYCTASANVTFGY